MSIDKTSTSIIVIDGSSASRKLVSKKLAKSRPGILIDAHATARSATAKLRDNSYDLVALGHTLPDGNGLDLAAKIRTQGKNVDTPIVMIAANSEIVDTQIRSTHGINSYFDKSDGLDALVEFLESQLPEPSLPAPHILFIDDSKTVIKMVSKNLEKHRIPVTMLTTSKEAVQVCETLGEKLATEFDVLITDLNLDGEVNGEDLVKLIRQDLKINKQDLPILLATGSENGDIDISALRKLGVNDFLNKPFDHELMMARIEPWMLLKKAKSNLKP